MPKIVLTSVLEEIETVIRQYPEGVRLDELYKTGALTLARRTLQRHLHSLVQTGRLTVSGKGIHCRYHACTSTSAYGTWQIPVTSMSLEIQRSVNQPLEQRVPVKYNPDFLNSYHPNKTYYLTPERRAHLKQIGSHHTSDPQPIAGTVARKILHHLLIDLSWNSSRLEGNTYSLLETERLLEFGEISENKSTVDTQMLLNHKAAIEFLIEEAEEINYNRATILNLHALLSDNLLSNQKACGRLRNIPVAIAKTVYCPINIPHLIEEHFQKILDIANKIQDPFEQAFFTMVHLPYLQPFEDVNKRVSRLAVNIALIKNNYSPLSFVDVPEKAYIDGLLGVYELNRPELFSDVFMWAYERSVARYTTARQVLGEPDLFRLKYREQIIEVIKHLIDHCLATHDSVTYLDTWTQTHIEPADRLRFKEVIETALLDLHEGNIARFKIRTAEFIKWHQKFTSK